MQKMNENNEITELFRNRLSGAEIPVREGFWEELECALPLASSKKTILFSPRFCRIAAAASIVFVLGAASAAFWYFFPKDEIQDAFTQMAAMTPDGSLNGDVAQESFPNIHQASPVTQSSGSKQTVGTTVQADDESVSVHLSIRITQRVYGNGRQQENAFYDTGSTVQAGAYHTDEAHADVGAEMGHNDASAEASKPRAEMWQRYPAVKAGIGTSLPKGNFNMPLTADISVEYPLDKIFSVEAGIRYSRLSGEHTLHTLGIPVRLDMMLANTPKVDLYAMVGGAAEKCVAGAPDNGFSAEPVQLSVAAGVGVRYKMNERFAIFAEPSVSHHFDTESHTRSLRTERSTNLNLLCGVRMTY